VTCEEVNLKQTVSPVNTLKQSDCVTGSLSPPVSLVSSMEKTA